MILSLYLNTGYKMLMPDIRNIQMISQIAMIAITTRQTMAPSVTCFFSAIPAA